ncbi:MAG: hypothetical protein Q9166_007311 [cf. Caloplaca sp. 2 TL-2023]
MHPSLLFLLTTHLLNALGAPAPAPAALSQPEDSAFPSAGPRPSAPIKSGIDITTSTTANCANPIKTFPNIAYNFMFGSGSSEAATSYRLSKDLAPGDELTFFFNAVKEGKESRVMEGEDRKAGCHDVKVANGARNFELRSKGAAMQSSGAGGGGQ